MKCDGEGTSDIPPGKGQNDFYKNLLDATILKTGPFKLVLLHLLSRNL